MVLLDLLNPPVDTQAMLFMDHIIPYGQLGKALYLPALIGCLLPSPLLPGSAEHIALGDDHKLDLRILKPPVKIAVGHQKFSRLYPGSFLLRKKRAKLILS